jgi:hypothetical protein
VFKLFCQSCMITSLVTGTALATVYVVKPDETLSEIAHSMIPGPVWGTRGSLAQVLKVNSNIKNPNLITIGQKIFLPENTVLQAQTELKAQERTLAEVSTPESAASEGKSAVPENSEHTNISLGFGLYQSKLSSTDLSSGGKSILGSAFSPELSVQWNQYWQSGLKTYILGSVRFENYSTTSQTQTVPEHQPTEVNAEIGARVLKLSDRGELGLSLSYAGEPFVRASSITTLALDAVSIPKANISLNYDFYRSVTLKLSAISEVSYLGPASTASYEVKSGVAYALGVRLTEERSHPIFAELKYSEAFQNTSITNETYSSLGLNFGMSFDVGSGK